MPGRLALVIALVLVGVAAAVLLIGGGDEETMSSTTTVSTIATTSVATPSTLAESAFTTSEGGGSCEPISGLELRASGPVVGYPPGGTVDGRVILGSGAEVRVRTDSPGNRNLVIFRLVYLEGEDLHAWVEDDAYNVALTYEPADGLVTGTFPMRYSVNESGPEDTPAPETARVDLIYDAAAGRMTGMVIHPDATFDLDMEAEEVEAEFFIDVSCYPTPTEPQTTP